MSFAYLVCLLESICTLRRLRRLEPVFFRRRSGISNPEPFIDTVQCISLKCRVAHIDDRTRSFRSYSTGKRECRSENDCWNQQHDK